jgi:hypothetical protein
VAEAAVRRGVGLRWSGAGIRRGVARCTILLVTLVDADVLPVPERFRAGDPERLDAAIGAACTTSSALGGDVTSKVA